MQPLVINATISTPFISFNNETGILEISGTSRPENVFSFFNPTTSWLMEYSQSPHKVTTFCVKLNYFNSSTAQVLHKMIKFMDALYRDGFRTEVVWFYAEDDLECYETGQDYASLVSIPFRYVITKSN